MEFFKKAIFKIIYFIMLGAFSLYILLDMFIIEKVEISNIIATNNKSSNSTSTNNSENSATNTEESKSSNYTITSNTYSDDNITIKISEIRQYNTDIYIADVQLSSIEYLKTAFANSTYGRNIKAKTSTIAEQNNAILAINGDFYGYRNKGFVLRNGIVYRNSINTSGTDEDLVINSNGDFSIVQESTSDINEILNQGALQVLSFGPSLINNSTISVSTTEEVNQSKSSNPRTVIGQIDSLHYVFVVSDGRTSASSGLSLYELAEVMQNLGCKVAYNLDGGGSSTMYFNGEIVNNPTDGMTSGERSVSDIVYIGY